MRTKKPPKAEPPSGGRLLSTPGSSARPSSPASPPTHETPPADWVALADIGAPIGLKGAVRIHTLKSVTGLPIDDSLLFDARACWLRWVDHQQQTMWLHAPINAISAQTRGVKLELRGIETRDQAERLRGAQVGLSRALFPQANEDEAYWADLMGCTVVNRQGHAFGPVIALQTNGEHDWLVVATGMIPFVGQYIDEVDIAAKRIAVDWQPEWFS